MLQLHLEVGQALDEFVVGRQELVQRRVKQTNDDRRTVHRPEQTLEVGPLQRQQLLNVLGPLGHVLGHDHRLDDRQALGFEEHVLGAHQAEALGAVAAGAFGIPRVVGVSPHAQAADLIRPPENLAQVSVGYVRDHGGQRAEVNLAERPVQRDEIALLDDVVADLDLAGVEVDLHLGHANDGGLAELARHERRMAGSAAAAGQNSLGRKHAVNVIRLGFGPHHYDGLVLFLRPQNGGVRVEGDYADSGARRDVQSLRDQPCRLAGAWLELRVQEELDLLGLDPANSLLLGDQSFLDHVDRDPHLRLGRALAVAGLQNPELGVLDGELDVLHVAVVLFEPPRDLDEFAVALGHRSLQVRQRLGLADARDHVLALSVDQIVAFRIRFPGGGVARHGDAGGAIVAHVAKHHGLDVDRRTKVVGIWAASR